VLFPSRIRDGAMVGSGIKHPGSVTLHGTLGRAHDYAEQYQYKNYTVSII
jgi:hypothetical protein